MNGVEVDHGKSTPASPEGLEELKNEHSRRSEAEEIGKVATYTFGQRWGDVYCPSD